MAAQKSSIFVCLNHSVRIASLPPPIFCEGCHGGLSGRRVAVCRSAYVAVVAARAHPSPSPIGHLLRSSVQSRSRNMVSSEAKNGFNCVSCGTFRGARRGRASFAKREPRPSERLGAPAERLRPDRRAASFNSQWHGQGSPCRVRSNAEKKEPNRRAPRSASAQPQKSQAIPGRLDSITRQPSHSPRTPILSDRRLRRLASSERGASAKAVVMTSVRLAVALSAARRVFCASRANVYSHAGEPKPTQAASPRR